MAEHQAVPNHLHCFYCFEVLCWHMNGAQENQDPLASFTNDAYPLFVTWHIQHRGKMRLRGCIGNFSALPLHQGLKEYALISATRDSRFDPIARHELDQLSCSVSLLTDFQPANHWTDWEIGTHGIQIEFEDPVSGCRRSATYLPEVADEQGWQHKEALESLLLKSGYRGPRTESFMSSIKVTRYQSRKCSVAFREFEEWRRQRKQ